MAGSPERPLSGIDQTAERIRREQDKAQIDEEIRQFDARVNEELIPLYSEFSTHSEERRYLPRRLRSLRDTYKDPSHRAYHSRRARMYRVLDLFLPRNFVERLTGIPLEKTENDARLVAKEERRLHSIADAEEERVRNEKAPLLERRRETEGEARRREEPEITPPVTMTTAVPELITEELQPSAPPLQPEEARTQFSWREGLMTVSSDESAEETPQSSAPEIRPEEVVLVPEAPAEIVERTVASKEKKEEPKWPLGIRRTDIRTAGKVFSVKALSEEEIEKLIATRARKLARGDTRILTDCRKMIESLRKDPYGEGTEKLTGIDMPIGYIKLPLHSFNPRKRPGFTFKHPMAGAISGMALRVIYAIREQNGNKMVILEGIYTHKEYDQKFALAKLR